MVRGDVSGRHACNGVWCDVLYVCLCVCPCESVLVVTLGRVRLCFSLSGPRHTCTLPEYSFLELLLESWRARRIERRDQTRLNSTYKQLGSSNPSLSCSHNTAIGVVVSGLLIQQTLAMLLVTPTPRQSDQPSADCTVEDRTAVQHAPHHAEDELHGTRTQSNP